ncbi:glycosyltransferase [Massilia sp. NR 4-1]|uniref:glycosyltransferase n=1 Tax=Massilia sp. NR 4-1 TaxID=1678028 RepID=UPI00067DD9C9|nr:glycosyltransferase [Massilia sp. NR 4-1]AKU24020.1 hypothetical protein ACZ75_23740 [Massilia sp. NR 4-1]
MRIVIDLQGAQSESRFRGIGRYSLALALGMARNAGPHEIRLVLNAALGAAIEDIRHAFAGLVPRQHIHVFDIAGPAAEMAPEHSPNARASELLREHFIARLQPDAVLVTSLFEGYVDDSVTSIGRAVGGARCAAVLYDLIPFLNPDAYLALPAQRAYYERKIVSLRRAGLLLSISDYSRLEALQALGLAPEQVVSISTAVDESFQPGQLDADQLAALHARFAIARPFLMYAPGGFDARKNIDGLISAFSLLPPAQRMAHQLLIASKIGERERAQLEQHARRCGLAPGELILTGYVSDRELIDLYRAATLFIFPSKHEGFGLPALEAMACGALVIGADNTSIPEVIGCAEALFDAADPAAIAARITEVLGDAALQQRLRAHGRQQAARFSWDHSGRRALRALEQLAQQADAAEQAALRQLAAPARKRRLAFVTPLPPERTGIADYAAQLLPALLPYFDIELVLQQEQLQLAPELAALPRRSVAWFRAHAHEYAQILYQFGNSPFHSHMFALLQEHPGVVVLHDFFLSSVLAYEQMTGGLPGAWHRALQHSHGYAALQAGLDAAGQEAAKDRYPCNLEVLEGATRVIVHSEHARELAAHWYGPQATHNWSVVPLPRSAPLLGQRAAARAALGIGADRFLVCTFGFIAPTKHSLELLHAWLASALHQDARCELVFVGANHGGDYGLQMTAAIRAAGAGTRIRIAGWTDEADYQRYLQAADAGVQLRSISRGETSAAVLDCMNYGLPTIVNANGSMAALPADSVYRLDERFSQAALAAALEALHGDAARRAQLGQAAAALLHTQHSPAYCAGLYRDALDLALLQATAGRPALYAQLAAEAAAAPDEPQLQQLARCVARAPDALAPRQLLVDVTAIARHDLKTGIERVVRTQLLELLQLERPGLRVEPVYLSDEGGHWHYRYARNYAWRLTGAADHLHGDDPLLDLQAGDLFYSADYSPGAVMAAAHAGVYANLRARGVAVNFLVHDLLPVLRPEFFPPRADLTHGAWLACIAAEADCLLCISAAVRDELAAWLAAPAATTATAATRGAAPQLAVLHHGADIVAEAGAAPATVPPPADTALLAQLAGAPSFLMVGTIEPRKGHLQALDAFERLWAEGGNAQLVIVGNEGWRPLPAAERRTIPRIVQRLENHPELGRRLFWLRGVDDALLQQIYQASACLLAPSEGEGFGLPLIEGARFGLPLLVRDIPVFREVAGTAAVYFSGLDGEDLAQAVRAWLAAPPPASRTAGLAWITWRENVQRLLDLLEGPTAALA